MDTANQAKVYGELLGLSQRQEDLARMVGLMNLGNIILVNEVKLLRKQLSTLQGVVSSLQQDVATLEENFSLMEKVLNVEVLPHIDTEVFFCPDCGNQVHTLHDGLCMRCSNAVGTVSCQNDIDFEAEYQRQESPESRRNGYGAEV